MSDSNAMLLCADIESSPLIEEMNKLNNASSKSSNDLHTKTGHNREADLIATAVVNHDVKMYNTIIVARRVILNVTTRNGRKKKERAR